MPYQTNGLRADSANKATFTNYAIAVRHRAGYDGIGIGVFGDICAIDIDSCVENGVLSDMAENIIARMDTYTEYSPSGTGVRILFKASLPAYDKDRYYINNRQIKLEVYVAGYTSRFVTVTGNAISGAGIEERTDALAEVLEKYMRKSEKPVSRVTAPGSYLSDTSVLQKAMASKQAEKFKALWNGIIPDGKSHSEADAALCAMLAFWCGGDTEQMDRLFRQSALIRTKSPARAVANRWNTTTHPIMRPCIFAATVCKEDTNMNRKGPEPSRKRLSEGRMLHRDSIPGG